MLLNNVKISVIRNTSLVFNKFIQNNLAKIIFIEIFNGSMKRF